MQLEPDSITVCVLLSVQLSQAGVITNATVTLDSLGLEAHVSVHQEPVLTHRVNASLSAPQILLSSITSAPAIQGLCHRITHVSNVFQELHRSTMFVSLSARLTLTSSIIIVSATQDLSF